MCMSTHIQAQHLQAIHVKNPTLGKPHGAGLLQGLDIRNTDGSPNPKLAARIMNHMRQNRVLIGTTGPSNNILKIRPPIIFNQEHSEILLASLLKALNDCI